jgi:hypothetical protein
MYLDGEHLMPVKELQQQRESLETLSQLSHQLLLGLFHQLTDSLSLERPVGNAA